MKGFDVYKRVMGRKRHVLVDTNGFILVLRVTGANVQDRQPVIAHPDGGQAPLPSPQEGVGG